MKFVESVACIFLCVHRQFGEKIYYNSRDIEYFLGDCFLLAHPRLLFNHGHSRHVQLLIVTIRA